MQHTNSSCNSSSFFVTNTSCQRLVQLPVIFLFSKLENASTSFQLHSVSCMACRLLCALRLMWTLLLLIWSLFLWNIGLFLSHTLASVSAVVVATSSLTANPQDTPDPVSVMIVELWTLVMFFGRRCTVGLLQLSQAITSAFIIGMSALANCFSWSLRYLLIRCYGSRKSYVTAHTPLSTKIPFARYSDL